MPGADGMWSITFSGVERRYRTVTVKARSSAEAKRIARQIATNQVEAEEHDGEDAGEWCDGSGVDAKSVRVESVQAGTTDDVLSRARGGTL